MSALECTRSFALALRGELIEQPLGGHDQRRQGSSAASCAGSVTGSWQAPRTQT